MLKSKGIKRRVVVVNPRDASSVEALRKAEADGFVVPEPVDDMDHPQAAAEAAVELVQAGKADVL